MEVPELLQMPGDIGHMFKKRSNNRQLLSPDDVTETTGSHLEFFHRSPRNFSPIEIIASSSKDSILKGRKIHVPSAAELSRKEASTSMYSKGKMSSFRYEKT